MPHVSDRKVRAPARWALVVAFGLVAQGATFAPDEPGLLDPLPPRPQYQALAHELAARLGGDSMAVRNTGSMEPALSRNHLIVVAPADFADIEVGDIVVFRRRQSVADRILLRKVVHRVVGLESCDGRPVLRVRSTDCWRLQTQGDALADPDPTPVAPDTFVGKVAYAIDGQTGEVRGAAFLALQAPSLLPVMFRRDSASL